MCVQFTDVDVEKVVETASGEVIGTVTAVEGETARVEPSPGMMDTIRSALGWSRSTGDTARIHGDAVAEIAGDVIRLEEETDAINREPFGTEADREFESGVGRESESGVGRESESDTDRESGSEMESGSESSSGTPVDESTRETVADDPTPGPGLEADDATIDDEVAAASREPEEVDSDVAGAPEKADDERGAPGRADAPAEIDGAAERAEREGSEEVEGRDATDGINEPETESEERGTEDPNLGDELNRGTDLESIVEDDAVEETDGRPERETVGEERASIAELDYEIGVDPASTVDDTDREGGPRERHTTDDRDVVDDLNPGPDIESVAGSEKTDASRAADADDANEERNLADELNRGVDLESAVTPDREADAETDLAEANTAPVDAEVGPETDARRIAPEIESDAEPEADRSDETPTDEGRSAVELEVKTGDEAAEPNRDRGWSGSRSPLGTLFAAQRTAIEGGQRAFEQGLTAQHRVARNALRGQERLQRRSIELARTATAGYFDALTEITGTATGADREGLELVDGIDGTARRRLETAGITSLDDLARADAATVADAADVAERRAANWIDRAGV